MSERHLRVAILLVKTMDNFHSLRLKNNNSQTPTFELSI